MVNYRVSGAILQEKPPLPADMASVKSKAEIMKLVTGLLCLRPQGLRHHHGEEPCRADPCPFRQRDDDETLVGDPADRA